MQHISEKYLNPAIFIQPFIVVFPYSVHTRECRKDFKPSNAGRLNIRPKRSATGISHTHRKKKILKETQEH